MLSFKYHEITLHSSWCLLTITRLAILLKLVAAVVVKKKIQLFQVSRYQLIDKLYGSLTEISPSNSKYVLYIYYILYIYLLYIYIRIVKNCGIDIEHFLFHVLVHSLVTDTIHCTRNEVFH